MEGKVRGLRGCENDRDNAPTFKRDLYLKKEHFFSLSAGEQLECLMCFVRNALTEFLQTHNKETMNETNDKRFPHLGKLSVSVIESLVKPVVGDDAIKQIKAPVEEKKLRQSLSQVLSKTEQRFISEYSHTELVRGILDLPIASLPSVKKAIRIFYERPSDPKFKALLVTRLQSDYPSLPEHQITLAVSSFVNILRQELVSISPEIQEKLQTLAALGIQEDISRIAKSVESIQIGLSSDKPQTTRGYIPPPPSMIIGREDDLAELKKRLGITQQVAPSTQVLTAIRGWPGVGKTTIASAIAHDPMLSESFPDGVLWVSLGTEPNLLSEMAAWGRALGTNELLRARSLNEAQTQLASLLRNKQMLLIVDDVWQLEHAVLFDVGGQHCSTLITTRLNDVARSLAPNPEHVYLLPVLTDENALELLRELAPDVHPELMLELVHELEGLPLALQVAGRLLQAEVSLGFGIGELIAELRGGAKLLEAEAPPDRADLVNQTTPSIAALLQKSTDLLDERTRDCYAYLGVFAPKPATFDLEAMAFVWQMDDPKPVVRTLVNRGLLEYVSELERYQMHAILVMQAKSLLTEE